MRITKLTQIIEGFAARVRAVYWITSLYYKSVVRREISLANITADDNVLCIGGGACPFSAILLHQTTGARVTVIDKCEACAEKSRHLIGELGLGEHIRVLCRDGGCTDLSLSEYSVVHFALQVCPMEDVFSKIEERVSPGTKLLIRRPKKSLCGMYCGFLEDNRQQNAAPAISTCRHNTVCNIGCTLLYVKQESSFDVPYPPVPCPPVSLEAA